MTTYHYNLGSCFEEVVSAHTARPALRYPDEIISYGVMMVRAQKLATYLMSRGCRQGDVIAIGHNKRPLSYALMIAALRLGIAYVNLDVASPVARSSRILEIGRPSFLFFDDPAYALPMEELASAGGCPLIYLDDAILPDISEEEAEAQHRAMLAVDGATIAYIMFTSGSTGVPKGVAVTHQNILHFISWGKSRFDINDADNFANLSPMYFDNSVFDFYVGLFSGASLTPVYREMLTSPYELVSYVGQTECTIWFSVPSLLIYLMTMKAMSTEALSGLRTIVFGGEGYPKVELKKLFDRFSTTADLVNVYGPTECTCICSAYTLGEDDFTDLCGLPSLGNLNSNFDFRILDDKEMDAQCGELCLIGPNVAAGYFNDLDRSAEAFFTLTDRHRFMKKMYRTGDIVREDAGRLFFVGRKDNQIKHLGYRIELEEVEQGLVRLQKVSQAAVIYHRVNSAYGKLIGFVACSEVVDERILLEELGMLLPEYMIPSKLVVMDKLPMNANGKVDRHHLTFLLSH